jgi:hypothetical protein
MGQAADPASISEFWYLDLASIRRFLMPPSVEALAQAIDPWHDFWVMTGTAAATLIGLLFVAITVGIGIFTEEKRPAMGIFLSPSVVHFSTVLAASLIALAPIQRWPLLGALIGALGLFGVAYSGLVWRRMVRHGISAMLDRVDRIWYAPLPAIAYVILAGAAIALFMQSITGLSLLACGMGLLLIVGIRNAWDITTWSITHHRE